MRYVAKEKMWRTARNTTPLLGVSGFLRHILFSTRRVRERVEWRVLPDVGYFRNAFRSSTKGPSAWRENTTARCSRYLNTPTRFSPNEVGDDSRSRNKMWRRKSWNGNKYGLAGALRHIFSLATYRIKCGAPHFTGEIRPSGSEGGVALITPSLPLSHSNGIVVAAWAEPALAPPEVINAAAVATAVAAGAVIAGSAEIAAADRYDRARTPVRAAVVIRRITIIGAAR